jgi:hypothetical protein
MTSISQPGYREHVVHDTANDKAADAAEWTTTPESRFPQLLAFLFCAHPAYRAKVRARKHWRGAITCLSITMMQNTGSFEDFGPPSDLRSAQRARLQFFGALEAGVVVAAL